MATNKICIKKASYDQLSALGEMRPLLVLVICLIILPLMLLLSGNRLMSSVVWLQGVSVTIHEGDYFSYIS